MTRIFSLHAENFKRLRAVDITPTNDQSVVELRGPNGAGKSSVIDAIWAALGGATALPSHPIRRGAEAATIRLDLGDLRVTRRFLPSGSSSLRVEAADGARYPSPQAVLDRLVGAVAFDPLQFVRSRPKEQRDLLASLVPDLIQTLKTIDQDIQRDYDRRTDLNRDLARLRSRLEAADASAGSPTVSPSEQLPADPIDLDDLTRRLADASSHNAERERRLAARENAAEAIKKRLAEAADLEANADAEVRRIEVTAAHAVAQINATIDSLRRQIEVQEARLTEVNTTAANAIYEHRQSVKTEASAHRAIAADLQAKLAAAPPLPDAIDADALAKRLTAARATNEAIERRNRRAALADELAALTADVEALSARIDAGRAARATAIQNAKMPIPHLSLGDDEVLFNDLPLDQASQAEKIRVAAAIAMAANPSLRVLAIRDGSLLDHQSLALLTELVTQNDYQLWLEVTDDDASSGIIIEDGSVREPSHPEPTIGFN